MSTYQRITQGVNDKGFLFKAGEKLPNIRPELDYYVSIFHYNDEHYKKFQTTKSVAGIKDVKTNILAFDFDSKLDLEKAREDAIELIARLSETLNVELEEQFNIYFSGMKGFTIILKMDKWLNPEQVSNLALNVLGKDLKTLDPSLYNSSRILRVPGTKHQESCLYKIPITYDQLKQSSIEEIKQMAESPKEDIQIPELTSIPEEVLVVKDTITEKKPYIDSAVDYSRKPKNWTNCKWSLLQGQIKQGERHSALMVLASTCRGLGFTKDMTYDMAKGALRRSIDLYGKGSTDKEELYKNIIEDSVFTDSWNGGQYSCKKPGFLQTYCKSLGSHSCKDSEEIETLPAIPKNLMWERFIDYAENFEKNLIKTGLRKFDENVVLTTSALYGLLGAPGSAKTTLALQFLRNASKNNIQSMFFSMDMGDRIISAKLLQHELGISYKSCLELVKSDKTRALALIKEITPKYDNVHMNFNCGLSVEGIRRNIEEQNRINGPGNEVKFVVIDYLENIASEYSDATASGGFIANKLKDMATELNLCLFVLLQTQKHSTPEVSDPLLSLRGVKGSSLIEQACSCIISIWREAYGPNYTEDDKYISMALVKNRFGELWRENFSWDGMRGNVSELTQEQEREFNNFLRKKEEMKKAKVEAQNEGWQ